VETVRLESMQTQHYKHKPYLIEDESGQQLRG